MSEFVDDLVQHERGAEGLRPGRAPIEEAIDGTADRQRGEPSAGETFVADGVRRRRSMPDSVKAGLAKIDAELARRDRGIVEETPVEEETPAEGEPAAVEAAPAPEAAAAAAAAPAEPAAAPPPSDDLVRLTTENQRLAAELEAARAKPTSAPTIHTLLSEAHVGYVDDQVSAVRKLIAAAHGIEDAADPRIDSELRDLYTDLTAWSLGVSPEEAHLSKRNRARVEHLLKREKEERAAEGRTSAEKAKAEAEAHQAQQAAAFIGNRLATRTSGDKTIADEYPLLMALAERLDGMKPEALLVEVLRHETKTGKLVLTADDDANIRAAAKLIESRYQPLAEIVGGILKPSTAQPSGQKPPAATPSTSQVTRQTQGARNLTTADASVAPATPPASKPQTTTKPVPFRNKKARREAALSRLDRR